MADDEDDGFTLSGWVQDGPQTPETMRAVAEHTKSIMRALKEVPPEHMQNVIGSFLCSVAVMYDQPVHFLMHAMTGAIVSQNTAHETKDLNKMRDELVRRLFAANLRGFVDVPGRKIRA